MKKSTEHFSLEEEEKSEEQFSFLLLLLLAASTLMNQRLSGFLSATWHFKIRPTSVTQAQI
jgi:hypothetical protein